MSIIGYATSRSQLTAMTQLIARMLTRTTQEVRSAHVHIQLTLLCKQYESPHWSLSPSDVTLTLDSARLDVFRAF